MKSLVVFLFILLSGSTVYSQYISAGVRGGGSKWSRFEYKYPRATPDRGLFLRAEPIKRLAFEVSYSKYSLHRGYSAEYNPGIKYASKHDLSCNEIGIAAQYNYLRMFKGHLKLYAGMDCEPTIVGLTTEEYNKQPYRSALIPYQKTKMTFLFYLVGLHQTFLYDIGKVNVLATIFYRSNTSGLDMNSSYYPGSTRIGISGGVSYKIL